MNAEALIGTVLGTCKLQQVIGQGGMGAVYLAQQTRPRRQVAVKVLLPITPLPPNQLAAFLERFRRETDAVASLEHPNIIPVYEYDEYNGLAYLVMPFISGGTLRDIMDLEGALPLPKVVSYLEQLAAALDFAHERGVIHRDIKPANILLTPQGRLLLTDFGLVKVSVDGQEILRRLTGPGAPVGTPDYMSPEQVLGEPVDGRADLYSLGVILYHMVTGATPFQGATSMQIAAQHLQTPPHPPRFLRPDLPIAAEQVMLRAMAKRPADRYPIGQELVTAFRGALQLSGFQLGPAQEMPVPSANVTGARLFMPRGLHDPTWQTGAMPTANASPPRSTGLLSAYKTGIVPGGTRPLPTASLMDNARPVPTGTFPTTGAQPAMPQSGLKQMSPVLNTTGALMVPNFEQGSANTIKLTGPVKVVQMPIAGQPGRYVTGLLPVSQPQQPETVAEPQRGPWRIIKIIVSVLAVLLIIGAGLFWLLDIRTNPTTQTQPKAPATLSGTPDLKATALAQATATASANILLVDPLTRNINNWPTDSNASASYAFTAGAYHITNLGDTGTAVVLQSASFNEPIGYTLTIQEIKGDDTSLNNSFGMIIRSSVQKQGSRTITTFYSFEVFNTPGGRYKFYKYNDSQGTSASPWTELWSQPFGSEFHMGHGLKS